MAVMEYDYDKKWNMIHLLRKKTKKKLRWNGEIMSIIEMSYFYTKLLCRENRALNYKPRMASSVEHCMGSRRTRKIKTTVYLSLYLIWGVKFSFVI